MDREDYFRGLRKRLGNRILYQKATCYQVLTTLFSKDRCTPNEFKELLALSAVFKGVLCFRLYEPEYWIIVFLDIECLVMKSDKISNL